MTDWQIALAVWGVCGALGLMSWIVSKEGNAGDWIEEHLKEGNKVFAFVFLCGPVVWGIVTVMLIERAVNGKWGDDD